MSISRWNPWGEMMSLRDAMDELLRESFVVPRVIGGGGSSSNFGVPVDVRETNDDYTIKAVLPGVKPDDVHVQVKGDTLTISGEVQDEAEHRSETGTAQGPMPGQTQGQPAGQMSGQTATTGQSQGTTPTQGQTMPSAQTASTGAQRPQWLIRERRFGRFQRTITLPTPVQADQAQASFEHGILSIMLPKAQEARARSIPIQSGSPGQEQSQSQRPAIETQGQVHGTGQTTGRTQTGQHA